MGMSGLKKLKNAHVLRIVRNKGVGSAPRKRMAKVLKRLRKTPTGRQTASTIRAISKSK